MLPSLLPIHTLPQQRLLNPLPQQPPQPIQNHFSQQPLQLIQGYLPQAPLQFVSSQIPQQQQHLQIPKFSDGASSYFGPVIAIPWHRPLTPAPLTPAPPDPQPESVFCNLEYQPEVRLPNLPDLIIEPALSLSRQSNSSYSSSITASQEVIILAPAAIFFINL